MSSDKKNVLPIINALICARHNIVLISSWAGDLDYKAISADQMRCYAIQYAFIVMASAIKDVPQATLKRYEDKTYWRNIIDFRNHLAHTYDDMLDHRIMITIHSDLPALDYILKRMLDDLESLKK